MLASSLKGGWAWVLAGTVFVMAWNSLTLPAIFAIIGDSLPTSRRAIGFGVQSILKRVPVVLAPPLGGALIAGLGFIWGTCGARADHRSCRSRHLDRAALLPGAALL